MTLNIDIETAWEALELEECLDTSNLVYSGDLESLSPGDIITVKGYVEKLCERFSVNLLSVPEKPSLKEDRDVALHLNPRLCQRYIVRNTKLDGLWGQEETAAPLHFPMTRNDPFSIDIFIGDESFFIQVNEVHFCQFQYRVPFYKICAIEVRGANVKVDEVLRGHAPSYPSGRAAPPKAGSEPTKDILTWENPCTCVLPYGLSRNKQVVVCGRIKILPHSFSVNLQSSVHLWPHPEIELHFNPRFMQSSTGKQQVIWNSWQNGWNKELRTGTSALVPGGVFELRLQRDDNQFSVWEKNTLLGVFNFRCSPDNIKAVYVYGDVTIYDIYIQDAPLALGDINEDL